MLRRSPFAAVIATQIDQFEREHRDVLDDVAERLKRYESAGRDGAEELYGDYLDAVETGTELLADLRDRYASSLAADDAERYRRGFDRAVARRLPPFALEIENR